jgi:FAD:protein FMN transferase
MAGRLIMLRSGLLVGALAAVLGTAGAGPILARGAPPIPAFLPEPGPFDSPAPALAQGEAGRHEFAQVHMGVRVRLVLHAASETQARAAAAAAFERIAALDRMMSDYRDDSELRELGRSDGAWTTVSPDLFDVLARAVEMAEATGGAFDPTAGPLVLLWREARRTGRLPPPAGLDEARARVGWRHVELDAKRGTVRLARQGMRLDLGGVAKGYILQAAVETLASQGVPRALVEAGGDIVAGDAPPGRDGWRIDVPGADAAFAARAGRLVNAALATSGPAAQHVEIDGVRYSHTIDPRTGRALTSDVTAHVIAADGATADALATALTVLGPGALGALLERFPGTAAIVTGPAAGVRRGVTRAFHHRGTEQTETSGFLNQENLRYLRSSVVKAFVTSFRLQPEDRSGLDGRPKLSYCPMTIGPCGSR